MTLSGGDDLFLESVVGNIPNMVFVKDARDLRFVKVNKAGEELLGYTEAELLGKSDFDFFKKELAEFFTSMDRKVLSEGKLVDIAEEEINTRYHGTRILHTKKIPIVDEDGNPIYLLGISEDITDQRANRVALEEAKKDAERANNAKSEFLSRMSHELRTPLNSIIGFSNLMSHGDLTDRDRDNLDHIQRAGKHLLELINEILDIARIEAGKIELSIEDVMIDEVVGESISLIRPLASEKKIEIWCNNNSCGLIKADRQRIRQVLLNILSNAVKYNKEGGTVHVSCVNLNGEVSVTIRDTGKGIPADLQYKVFQPFERLGAEETGIEGTGVGLALSKALIDLMGGTIGFDSEPGNGTTFYFRLPRAGVVSPSAGRAKQVGVVLDPPKVAEAEIVGKVLYIEDNPANLALVMKVFESVTGIELLSATNGTLGLTLAEAEIPEVILLDVHLPDLSGAEVLRKLAANPVTSMIPVVVLSADATENQVARMYEAGAYEYLTKPIDVNHLKDMVDKLIAKSRRK